MGFPNQPQWQNQGEPGPYGPGDPGGNQGPAAWPTQGMQPGSGYTPGGGFNDPGGYQQPGGYPQPGGFEQPGGFQQPGGPLQPGGFQQPGVPGWPGGGYPPMGYRQVSNNSFAIASLVCGLAQFLLWFVFLVPGFLSAAAALGLGIGSLRQINQRQGQETGGGMAIAGIVLGALGVLGGIFWIVIFIIGSSSNFTPGGTFGN